MSGDAKAAVFMSAVSVKRSKVVGGLAVAAGLAAAAVGLVNVIAGNQDAVDVLLLFGGLLVSLVGLRTRRAVRIG
jgi:hypothetical protein